MRACSLGAVIMLLAAVPMVTAGCGGSSPENPSELAPPSGVGPNDAQPPSPEQPGGPVLVSRADAGGRPIEGYYRLPFAERRADEVGLLYSPDGRWAAYGMGDLAEFNKVVYDEVFLVELSSAIERKVFSFDVLGPGAVPVRDMYTMDLFWSHDSASLYIALECNYFFRYDIASEQLVKVALDPSITFYRYPVASVPGVGEQDLLVWERSDAGGALVLYGRDGKRAEPLLSFTNEEGVVWFRGLQPPLLLYADGQWPCGNVKALNLTTREKTVLGVGFCARFRPTTGTITFLRPAGYQPDQGVMEGPGFEVIEYVPGTGKESVIASFETTDKPVDAAWNASGNVLYLRGTLDAKVVFP